MKWAGVGQTEVVGLAATDYLNRFNEAIMLLDVLSNCPEFRADFPTGNSEIVSVASDVRIVAPRFM